MKKTYLVEFTEADGKQYTFSFTTEDIGKSIEQYCRNRKIKEHRILEEGASNSKQMLFG